MPLTNDDNVFVNCPFDDAFAPNFRAIVFSIYRCGFIPLSALSEDNALDNRLDKIEKLVENSKYGIHDISRTELNAQGLPRFNMPFELGIFFGAKRFGNKVQREKNALVFERTKFTYQNYLSDLNGVDIKAHNNDTAVIIKGICDWLKTSSKRDSIPGHLTIVQNFSDFEGQLPGTVAGLGLDAATIAFNDLCLIVEEFLRTVMK